MSEVTFTRFTCDAAGCSTPKVEGARHLSTPEGWIRISVAIEHSFSSAYVMVFCPAHACDVRETYARFAAADAKAGNGGGDP